MFDFLRAPVVYVWWTSVGLLVLVIFLRVWLVWRREKSFTIQDGFIVLTTVLLVASALCATMMYGVLQNVNERVWKQSGFDASRELDNLVVFMHPEDIHDALKWGYIGYMFYLLTLWSTKATLLSLYVKIMNRVTRGLRIFIIIGGVYFILTLITTIIMHLVLCGLPVNNNWALKSTTTAGLTKCQTYLLPTVFYTLTVFSTTLDVILMVQGAWTICLIHKSCQRENFAIIFIVAIGLASIVASCVKCGILSIFIKPYVGILSLKMLMKYTLWVSVETLTAILACTLPTLRGLVQTIPLRRTNHSTEGNSTGPSYGLSCMKSYQSSTEPALDGPDPEASKLPVAVAGCDIDTIPEMDHELQQPQEYMQHNRPLSETRPRVYYPPRFAPAHSNSSRLLSEQSASRYSEQTLGSGSIPSSGISSRFSGYTSISGYSGASSVQAAHGSYTGSYAPSIPEARGADSYAAGLEGFRQMN